MIDKWGGNDSFKDRAVTQLHSFTESLALDDFYRVSNLRGKIFTWFKALIPWDVGWIGFIHREPRDHVLSTGQVGTPRPALNS